MQQPLRTLRRERCTTGAALPGPSLSSGGIPKHDFMQPNVRFYTRRPREFKWFNLKSKARFTLTPKTRGGGGKQASSKNIIFARRNPTREYSQPSPHPPVLLLCIPKAADGNFKAKSCFQAETRGPIPSGFRELQEVDQLLGCSAPANTGKSSPSPK